MLSIVTIVVLGSMISVLYLLHDHKKSYLTRVNAFLSVVNVFNLGIIVHLGYIRWNQMAEDVYRCGFCSVTVSQLVFIILIPCMTFSIERDESFILAGVINSIGTGAMIIINFLILSSLKKEEGEEDERDEMGWGDELVEPLV